MNSGELFQKFHRDIYRYAFSRTYNREVAEDITSEAFKRMIEQKNFDPSRAKQWLFTVARNLVFDRTKSAANRLAASNEALENHLDRSTGQEEEITQEILVGQILRFLPSLDSDTSEIITLKVWDELQFNQIAEIINQKESTVKQKYYRGLEKLKQLVEESSNSQVDEKLILSALLLITTKPALAVSPDFVSRFTQQNLTSKPKSRIDLGLTAASVLLVVSGISLVATIFAGGSDQPTQARLCEISKDLVNQDFTEADELIDDLGAEQSNSNHQIVESESTHGIKVENSNLFSATLDLEKFKQENSIPESSKIIISGEIFDSSGKRLGSCEN